MKKRPLKSKELEELHIMTDSEGHIYRYITEAEALETWSRRIQEDIQMLMDSPAAFTRKRAEMAVGAWIVTEKEYRERFMKEQKDQQ